MKLLSIAAAASCLAVATADEGSAGPVVCPPCDAAEWKAKVEESLKLHASCNTQVADLNGRMGTCENSLAGEKAKLTGQTAEVERLMKMMQEKDNQLAAANTASEMVTTLRSQLATAEQEKNIAKESAAKNAAALQETSTALHSANEARDRARNTAATAQKKEEELKASMSITERELAQTRAALKQMKEEFDMKNHAIMDKEKFVTLMNNLWTFSKAGAKNGYKRICKVVGEDKVQTAVDMGVVYWHKTRNFANVYAVEPVNKYYTLYVASAAAPVIAQLRELAADGKDRAMVHLERVRVLAENHVNKQVSKFVEQEPTLADIIPNSFEDRMYALLYSFGAGYVACWVIGSIMNAVLATISLVCCCRRRQKTKDRKKSSTHKVKSSTSDGKKERKGSISTKPSPTEQPPAKPTGGSNGRPAKR